MEAKWIEAETRIKEAAPRAAEAQGEELVPESGARKYGQTAATVPVRAWTPGAPGEGCSPARLHWLHS